MTTPISIWQPNADQTFLALTVWREARGESAEAKLAVACTVTQRVKLRRWYGDNVMAVIFKKWQYSSMTNPQDHQLTSWPEEHDPSWVDSLGAARQALDGKVVSPTPGADSYFDISISPPSWAKPEDLVLQIGRLVFYDLNRDYEDETLRPPAGH